MVDSPKTLADVKALLEEAVQVVNNLEATSASADQAQPDTSAAPDGVTANPPTQPPADDEAAEDAEEASENETPSAPASDNPTPPTA